MGTLICVAFVFQTNDADGISIYDYVYHSMIKPTSIIVQHFNRYNFYQFIKVKSIFDSILDSILDLGLFTFSFIITSLTHVTFVWSVSFYYSFYYRTCHFVFHNRLIKISMWLTVFSSIIIWVVLGKSAKWF